MTSSFVLPSILGLKTEISAMKSRYHNGLLNTLRKSMETRLSKYEERLVYSLATVLDPRFKLQWCAQNPTVYDRVLSLLQKETKKNALDDTQLAHNDENSPPRKKSKLFRSVSVHKCFFFFYLPC